MAQLKVTLPSEQEVNRMDWTPEQERRLVHKIDLFVMPAMILIYLFAFIDRSNIGKDFTYKMRFTSLVTNSLKRNAKIAGLEKDLGLKGNSFNAALSVFYISYIIFQIPCNILCKRIGPGWFIPATTLAFGLCSLGTAFAQNYSSLCGVRFLLGIFESAMQPSLAYYLSRWYKRDELTFRISLYIMAASLAGAFGGLLASAILRLSSFGTLHSWRMIFAIEGIATCFLGLVSFVILTDRPYTAVWLTKEEKEIAVKRIQVNRTGENVVLDEFTWAKALRGILNPVVIATSFIFLLNSITVHGASFFLPSIVKTVFPNRTVQDQQLLSVPPFILGSICCLIISYASWKLDKRGIFLILAAPLTVVGYAIFVATENSTARYVAIFLPFVSVFSYGATTASHVSANVVSDTARSSAIGFNAMMGSIGGLISTWAFLDSDSPRYLIGNSLNLAAQILMFIIATGMYFWIKKSNEARDRVCNDTATEDMEHLDAGELDWRHPSLRWHN